MKNYRILTRLMLKNTLASMNPFAEQPDGSKKRRGKAVILALLALYGIGFVLWLEIRLYNILAAMGQGEMLPGLAILLGMLLTLVLGLFQGISELYQGKDAPFLAVLPVTSRQVFAAKLTTLWLSETAVNAAVVLPAFVLYAVNSGRVMPTVLTAIPVWLLLSVIPLCIIVVLATLLNKISFIARNRETVTMILSFALAIAYSLFITRFNNASDDQMNQMMATSIVNADLVGRLGRIFPPAEWAAAGFIGDWLKLLLLAAVSAGCAALVICAFGPGYIMQALSSGEQTVSARKSRSDTDMHSGSVFRALHRLEWRRQLRTPAWLFNGLAGLVMFPLMMGVGFVSGFSAAGHAISELLEPVPSAYIIAIGGLLCAMGSMINPLVSTAVSREGESWPFALSLPVDQERRFGAKLLVGIEISGAATLMIGLTLGLISGMSALEIAGMILLALLIDVAVSAVSLWQDATHPHFRWTNETECIKRNFNQVIGMLYWLAAIALCCVPMFFLFSQGGLLCACVLAIASLEMILSLALLFRTARQMTYMRE